MCSVPQVSGTLTWTRACCGIAWGQHTQITLADDRGVINTVFTLLFFVFLVIPTLRQLKVRRLELGMYQSVCGSSEHNGHPTSIGSACYPHATDRIPCMQTRPAIPVRDSEGLVPLADRWSEIIPR